MSNRSWALMLLASVSLSLGIVACERQEATPTEATVRDDAARSLVVPSLAHASSHSPARAAAPVTIPPVGGFASQVLSRGTFVDDIDVLFRLKEERGATTVVNVDDPSEMVMARITIQAGGALPWHTHPGPAMVTVTAGELTLVDGAGCEVRRYTAGQAFIDPGQGHVHTAFNATGGETVVNVTYLDVPTGQSPLVPVQNPGC
jgi:quercetin dioxygenase-like cupin family protein